VHAAALDAELRRELEGAGGARGKARLGDLFGRMVSYRNRFIGHSAVGLHATAFYERMGPLILAGVADILGRLDVLAGRSLVYVAAVSRERFGAWRIERFELTGEIPRRTDPLHLPESESARLPYSDCLYLQAPAGRAEDAAGQPGKRPAPGAVSLRSLRPLVVYDPTKGEVLFLNAQQGEQRAQYLCYTTGEVVDREELPGEQGELLTRVLNKPVDNDLAGQWAARAKREEETELAAQARPGGGKGPAPPADPVPAPAPRAAGRPVTRPAPAARPAPGPAPGAGERPVTRPAPAAAPAGAARVVLLYKRGAQPDEQLLRWLEREFTARGHQVFVDRHLAVGMEWAVEIARRIREADAVVPLLSAASVQSEMLSLEVETAQDEAQKRHGKPRLLPVRVRFEENLPPALSAILDRLQYFLWEGPEANPDLVEELVNALHRPPAAKPLRPPDGAIPLGSPIYIERPTDREFQSAIARQDSVVLIRGSRQVGKTSLLARGLQPARAAGARVVVTDFQKLNSSDLESVEKLFRTLGEWIANQLKLEVFPGDVWSARHGPSINFEEYVLAEALEKFPTPLVWAIDEVDRLFSCPFGSEVFGLFRSWHNARSYDEESPWARLTLAIAYATEAHLFITDMNQSPFNVGTRVSLEDFAPAQVAELNRRHGSPLRTEAELQGFYALVGGHPYLANRGLYEMAQRGLDLAAFRAQAEREDGIFGDHLRRILVLLAKDPALCEVVRGVLRGRPCPTPETFYRLRSAGVMAGDSARAVRPRCRLYADYLERHLL
jgi:hypothetical protein